MYTHIVGNITLGIMCDKNYGLLNYYYLLDHYTRDENVRKYHTIVLLYCFVSNFDLHAGV